MLNNYFEIPHVELGGFDPTFQGIWPFHHDAYTDMVQALRIGGRPTRVVKSADMCATHFMFAKKEPYGKKLTDLLFVTFPCERSVDNWLIGNVVVRNPEATLDDLYGSAEIEDQYEVFARSEWLARLQSCRRVANKLVYNEQTEKLQIHPADAAENRGRNHLGRDPELLSQFLKARGHL